MLTRIKTLVVLPLVLALTACETDGKRREKAKAQVAALRSALDEFNSKQGRFPDKLVELEMARVVSPLPKDPWGNSYQLIFDRGQPLVVCLGADGALGGTGPGEDLRSDKP